MVKNQNPKKYDLEERTFNFANKIIEFVKKLPKTICNLQDIPQLVKSSGSMGSNYIEANEAISKKDFVHRIKISRKESKESKYWLRLVDTNNINSVEKERTDLIQEAHELMMIFSSIMRKSE